MRLAIADLLPVAMAGLGIYKARPVKPISGIHEDYISLETGRSLRGVLAVSVILHHLARSTSGGTVFHAFSFVGFLCVAVFFFLSGYGLQKAHMRSENYRKRFLLKRLPQVLLPYLVAIGLFYVLYGLCGEWYSFGKIVDGFVIGDPIVKYSWYVVCILVFYVVYWLLMVIFKRHFLGMVIGAVVWYAGYVIFCVKMGYGAYWYNACPLLIVGMLWAYKESAILAAVKKHYILWCAGAALVFVAGILGKYKADALLPLPGIKTVCEALAAIAFVVCVLLFLMKVKIGNKALAFLGDMSLELYLVQGLFIVGLRSSLAYIENETVFILAALFGSLALAALLHKGLSGVLKAYRRRIDQIGTKER